MSNKFNDIEGLFKDSFENFEADVDPTIWENVSSQIGGQASVPDASSSASSASGSSVIAGSVVVKSVIIAGVAGVMMLGAYYLTESDAVESTPKFDEVSTEVNAVEVIEEQKLSNEQPTSDQKITSKEEAKVISATSQQALKVEIKGSDAPAKSQMPGFNEENNVVQTPEPNSQSSNAVLTPTSKRDEDVVEEDKELAVPANKASLLASIYASETEGAKPLTVAFENKGSQASVIRWKIAGTYVYDQESIITHSFEKSGKYWVVLDISDNEGQRSRDSVEIFVKGNAIVNVPNVFTPNGDGVHDAFVIEIEDIKSLRCTIMDRSGNVVFKWDNLYGHWDGRDMGGREMNPGTYIYIVEAVDNDDVIHHKRGMVNLYRN